MRHQDISDKIPPTGPSSVSDDAMAMSNQIGELMKEKYAANSNVNVVILGFPKDDILGQDPAAKTKLGGKPFDAAEVTFKKDAAGNLIKLVNDAGPIFPVVKDLVFQTDNQGNSIKVAGDGGPKKPSYSSNFRKGAYEV